jgi:hypothetical protein
MGTKTHDELSRHLSIPGLGVLEAEVNIAAEWPRP